MSISPINYGGFPEALARYQQMNGAKVGVQEGLQYIRALGATYPPASHRPVDTSQWTQKQRGYFFWALRNGIIDVPYERGISNGSERLGQSWTTATDGDGLSGSAGTNVSYSRLVQGFASQAMYHYDTGWQTDASIRDQAAVPCYNIIRDAMAREWG